MVEALSRIERKPKNGTRRHSFAVVGSKGAVEFWFHVDDMECSGFEKHARSGDGHWLGTPDHPSHLNCELLGGPCWHDGTSLWASEFWVPLYKTGGADAIWRELECDYHQRFADKSAE